MPFGGYCINYETDNNARRESDRYYIINDMERIEKENEVLEKKCNEFKHKQFDKDAFIKKFRFNMKRPYEREQIECSGGFYKKGYLYRNLFTTLYKLGLETDEIYNYEDSTLANHFNEKVQSIKRNLEEK